MSIKKDEPTRVRSGEEVDLAALQAYFSEQKIPLNGQLQLRQFPSGFSNLTYLITDGHSEWVLRKPPKGANVKSGHDMSREYRMLSALKDLYPVPKPIAFCTDPQVIGSDFYLMERVQGVILRKDNAEQLSQADFRQIAHSWIEGLVRLHQIDYKSTALKDTGNPDGYTQRQIEGWAKRYEKVKTDQVAEIEQAAQWLLGHVPPVKGVSIIHNDYKYDNIVFAPDHWGELKAVLDWEMATIGDPLMDLGTSLGYWVNENDPPFLKELGVLPTYLPGNPTRGEVVEMYAKASGQSIDDVVFYYAYGLFKLAVVVQQIFYRYKKGYTQDPRFSQLDKAAKAFCGMALKAVSKGKIDNLF